MRAGDSADCSEPDFTRPAQVPRIATPVTWSEVEEPHDIAHRYGFIGTLLEAGIEANRIQVFHDLEDNGAYWVVTLDGGRRAVLIDDTEEHVSAIEGPWPLKVMFVSPDAVRTEIDYSINKLVAQVVAWYTEVAEPR